MSQQFSLLTRVMNMRPYTRRSLSVNLVLMLLNITYIVFTTPPLYAMAIRPTCVWRVCVCVWCVCVCVCVRGTFMCVCVYVLSTCVYNHIIVCMCEG